MLKLPWCVDRYYRDPSQSNRFIFPLSCEKINILFHSSAMLELDNLDLDFDLDCDFPTGPLNKISSSQSNPSNPNSFHENVSGGIVRSQKSGPGENVEDSRKQSSFNLNRSDLTGKDDSKQETPTSKFLNISKTPAKAFPATSHQSKQVSMFNGIERNQPKDTNSCKRVLSHRKFPGPAGLLPDKPLKDLNDINIIVDDSLQNVPPERKKESVILCSQSSSVFTEASYKKLMTDFDMTEENSPLNKYTIEWVKKKALQKSLNGKKIPFLAVVLQHLDHSAPDPVVKLMDSTAEIYGIIHRDVWNELGGKLHPGAALALRQIGVLITGINRRQIYLNITTNNVVNIYSYSDEASVETSHVNEFRKCDLMKDFDSYKPVVSIVRKTPVPQLFSTVKNDKLNSRSPQSFSNQPSKGFKCYNNDRRCEEKVIRQEGNVSKLNNESGTNVNDVTSMDDDDISDFLASLDDSTIYEESSKESTNFNSIDKSNTTGQLNNNFRKRKMEENGSESSSKRFQYKTVDREPSENGSSQGSGKFVLGGQGLSQMETKIIEEALDGIDFDDFAS